LDGAIAWNRDASIRALDSGILPTPSIPQDQVIETLQNYLAEKRTDGYRDAHRWVFTPESLTEIIRILSSASLISLEVCEVVKTNYYEFLMVVKKPKKYNNDTPELESRMEYLKENIPYFPRDRDSNLPVTKRSNLGLVYSAKRIFRKIMNKKY
jgi:hypothetical protein